MAAGTTLAGAALAGDPSAALHTATATAAPAPTNTVEPFYGLRQAGIITAPQRHTSFAAFDVVSESRSDLIQLLRTWTSAAREMAAGSTPDIVPVLGSARTANDSGEAQGIGAARLTFTFGFGSSLFERDGQYRFGLGDVKPPILVAMPTFRGDELVAEETGGDMTVQACADDPQIAFHAVRTLAKAADGVATLRWVQRGFNETAATAGTPRNLLGFKDGITNPTGEGQLREHVWVGEEGPRWLRGGSYVVLRKIRIDIRDWDAQSVRAQEQVIGRYKASGAPLSGRAEDDPINLAARSASGHRLIPPNSHVALASSQQYGGGTIFRRSYSYDDGLLAGGDSSGPDGLFDAGVLFVGYQRDVIRGFCAIFSVLSQSDALMRFTTHTGGAIAAVPPGVPGPGSWIGQALFE